MGVLSRFRSSITYPIAVTLVAVTVVPVLVVGFVLAERNKDHLTTVEKQYLTRQSANLAAETAMFLEGHRQLLGGAVAAMKTMPATTDAVAERVLRDLAREHPWLVQVQFVRRDGTGPFVRTRQLSGSLTTSLSEALLGLHNDVLENGKPADRLLTGTGFPFGLRLVGLPVRSSADGPRGVLAGAVSLEALARRIADESFTGLLVSVVDGDGKVLVSSRPMLVGENLGESGAFRASHRARVRLTMVYPHPVDTDLGRVLGSVAPVANTSWSVIVERPVSEAFAPVSAMQRRTALVSGVAALAALAVGVALSRRLITPLQVLAGASSRISSGDLTVRADLGGRNELAQLAENFNQMAGNVEALVRRLRRALRRNQELFVETIKTVAAAVDAKDPYTAGHSERVSSYAMAIAKQLGFDKEAVFRVRIAAILHDVGKLGIRDEILQKPTNLTDAEFEEMRRHPEIGAKILAPIGALKDIIPGIRNHHERWDGTGYPDGLKGEETPLLARIIGVSDSFDAMTTNRPYQRALSLEFVQARMTELAGTRYDPRVVDALLAAVERGDITPPQPTRIAEVT